MRSQAQLEKRIHEQELQGIIPGSVSNHVYEMEDWIVEMGQRKALLIPATRKWMWYDRLHDEWAAANCGIDEALLVTIGTIAGVKKLPIPGDVSEWCAYMEEKQLFGPLHLAELITKVKTRQVPSNIRVWSPKATSWLSITLTGNEVRFFDDTGNMVSMVD